MSLLSKNKNINPPESIDIVNLSDIQNDFGGSLRRYLEDNKITELFRNQKESPFKCFVFVFVRIIRA